MKRPLKAGLWITGSLIGLMAMVAVTSLLILQSAWFHEKVKTRIIDELERATGGAVTISSYTFDWRVLRIGIRDLTIHGTEPASAPPLLRARSIVVGLKVVSIWKKDVDIESLAVGDPAVNVIVAADGSTNIPEPKIKRTSDRSAMETILKLAIHHISIESGVLLFAGVPHRIRAKGDNLSALFSFDGTGPRYKGQLSIKPLQFQATGVGMLNPDVYVVASFEKNRIEVSSFKLDMGQSHLEGSGIVEDLVAPKTSGSFEAHLAVEQVARLVKIPVVKRGVVDLTGTAKYVGPSDYSVSARANMRAVAVEEGRIRISDIRGSTDLAASPGGIDFKGIQLAALGGRFTGHADLKHPDRFHVTGDAHEFPIAELLAAVAPETPGARKGAWNGTASGPVQLEGRLRGPVHAVGRITVVPGHSGVPVSGFIDAQYDSRGQILDLAKSSLSTPTMRLEFSGALGRAMQAHVVSSNLNELLPVINAIAPAPVESLPVRLQKGQVIFDGVVIGNINDPRISGRLSATSFEFSGIVFDSLTTDIAVSQSSLRAEKTVVARGKSRAQGQGTIALRGWKLDPDGAISLTGKIQGAELSDVLNEAGQKNVPVRGTLAASVSVTGTAGDPRATGDLTVTKGIAYEEPFDRLHAGVDYSSHRVEVKDAKIAAGSLEMNGQAAYEPLTATQSWDFRNGRLQFQVSTNDMAVQSFQTMKRLRPGVTGILRVNIQGAATIRSVSEKIDMQLTALNGSATTRNAQMDKKPIGDINLSAATKGNILDVKVDSEFLNSAVHGTGQWRLQPGYPGEAQVLFSRVSLGTARQWLLKPGEPSSLNVDGSAEGKVSISGPALQPETWRAALDFTKLELFPQQQGPLERFTLRNEGPVSVTLERGVLRVSNARLVGPSTNLAISGSATLQPKASLDLRVNGALNLAVVENFTKDIETTGTVAISASVRGAPDQPQLNGRLDIKNATLNIADVPSGLSATNGIVLFSGNQATIEDLKGEVGGGKVSMTGIVGYAGGELSYRVQSSVSQVRIRYPEGASTSADAVLTLSGTSKRSVLSGTVTVLRTGFNPRTDFSSILGKASEPVRTPSARTGPLSGLQFDVAIETAPDISVVSALAQDIQVEGTLRLQGTPYNPVLLGRLSITQGEITFFGTKYTVNQGTIFFVNPVKLEPTLNIDLETRARGVDVTLNVSGPINKLNLTPRSDPPLEFAEILALLATGSPPSSDPTFAARQTAQPRNFTQIGANALIGQVVANPVSSRLQRFFGVSKLKIDPQLTGVENNPQARLTLEQQVTKDLTFTYITNLSSSNQQIVRVEWSLNKQVSLLAVRDENGLFGLDFLYKKRFK